MVHKERSMDPLAVKQEVSVISILVGGSDDGGRVLGRDCRGNHVLGRRGWGGVLGRGGIKSSLILECLLEVLVFLRQFVVELLQLLTVGSKPNRAFARFLVSSRLTGLSLRWSFLASRV